MLSQAIHGGDRPPGTCAALPRLLLCLALCALWPAVGETTAYAQRPAARTIHTEGLARVTRGLLRPLSWRRPAPGPLLARLGARIWRGPLGRICRALRRRRADLVVLSDLHLGAGRLRGGKGHDQLEDFKVDRQLTQLVHHLLRRQRRSGRRLKLVLAGDVFDFVKTTEPPAGRAWPAGSDERETRPTEAVAVLKLRRILEGHPHVLPTLGRLLAAGHEVVLIPGNHDAELNFPAVQRELRQQLSRLRLSGRRGARRVARLSFAPWLHMHGRALIEHGQRYEPLTCIAHMLAPLEGQGTARRLRGSAANYLVAEMLNRIKRSIPELNFLPSGDRILLEVARRRPGEAAKLVDFARRIGERMGEPSPAAERALRDQHRLGLRQLAESGRLLRDVNATRHDLGMPRVSKQELLALLERFDGQAARPFLWRAPPPGSGLRRALGLLQPGELKQWLFPADRSTLREGQAFALTHLTNVMITGHTHSASHLTLARGRRTNHLVDSGTWTPVAGPDGAIDPRAVLTYVEVRQQNPRRQTVRLRRWDTRRRRGVTIPPTPLGEGQFLSEPTR